MAPQGRISPSLCEPVNKFALKASMGVPANDKGYTRFANMDHPEGWFIENQVEPLGSVEDVTNSSSTIPKPPHIAVVIHQAPDLHRQWRSAAIIAVLLSIYEDVTVLKANKLGRVIQSNQVVRGISNKMCRQRQISAS